MRPHSGTDNQTRRLTCAIEVVGLGGLGIHNGAEQDVCVPVRIAVILQASHSADVANNSMSLFMPVNASIPCCLCWMPYGFHVSKHVVLLGLLC